MVVCPLATRWGWTAHIHIRACITDRRGKHKHAKGDRLTHYVLVERPHTHGLTRYDRYVQNNGYIYAVDPRTNDVLALIGLASRLLN